MAKKSGKRRQKKTGVIRYVDYSLLAVIVFLICFGLVMLYSASAYEAQTKFDDGMYYLKNQAKWCAVGIVAMLFVSRMNYRKYAAYSPWVYGIAMLLMAMVRYSPLGFESYGSRRWLMIGGQSLQPSEIMKIAIILFIPFLICKMGNKASSWRGTITVVGWGALAAFGVFYLTDNLSTAVIVLGIACVIVFVIHPKTAPFLGAAAGGITLFVGASLFLGKILEHSENFRLRRILAWLDPEKYADSGGYQTLQGLYAIGSGGFFGKGLGNSVQKTVIPEAQNDYILAVICEELGVFGAIMVFLLFGILLYRLLFIAQNAPDKYGSLVVTGIFVHIALQVVLNVFVILNIIPTTGITLPFISYGGSSVFFLLVEMGVALGVSRMIKFEE